MPTLRLIESLPELRDNVARFNRDASAWIDLSRQLVRQTTYWVFDSDERLFGPSKFVGFKSMIFPTYKAGMAGETDGEKFDGFSTRTAIEQAVGQSFELSEGASRELRAWEELLFGTNIFEGIDQLKWRFLSMPSSRRYWAFFADPKIYDIETALNGLDVDTWTTKGKDVKRGDLIIFWRGLKNEHRGIVGLGEVLTDPESMLPLNASKSYFLTEDFKGPEDRILVAYYQPPRIPLWLDDDTSGVLGEAKCRQSARRNRFQGRSRTMESSSRSRRRLARSAQVRDSRRTSDRARAGLYFFANRAASYRASCNATG